MNRYTKYDKCQISVFFHLSYIFFTSSSCNVIVMPEVTTFIITGKLIQVAKAHYRMSACDGNEANP